MKMIRFLVAVFLGMGGLPGILAAGTFPDNPQTAPSSPTSPRFVLVPVAGASPSESGLAEFGGPAGAVTDLSIKVQQFAPGLYWVVMIRKSDGAAVTLAPLSVFDLSEIEPDRQAGHDPNQRASNHQVQVLETQALIKLPTRLDLADVAQLLVKDVNGSVVLTGAPARP